MKGSVCPRDVGFDVIDPEVKVFFLISEVNGEEDVGDFLELNVLGYINTLPPLSIDEPAMIA